MFSEATARTKVCPYLRPDVEVQLVHDVTTHRVSYFARCQASDCMMWRWGQRTFGRETELWSRSKNQRVNSAFGDDAQWRPKEGEPTEPPPPLGFCGAALSAGGTSHKRGDAS